jgi:FkbM family methyltransferase
MKRLLKRLLPPALWGRLQALRYHGWALLRAWLLFRRRGYAIVQDGHGCRYRVDDWPTARRHIRDGVVLDGVSIQQFAAQVLRSGDVAVDIGANVGGVALPLAQQVGATGRVYAIEAEQKNYEHLQRNVALNGLAGRLSSFHYAACASDGPMVLHVFDDPDTPEWHSLGRFTLDGHTPETTQTVPGIRLDTFCQQQGIEHIRLLKVDVEGAEPDVFAGAGALLAAGRVDYLLFEISLTPLSGLNYTVTDVVQPLLAAGYAVRRLVDGRLETITLAQIAGIDYGNYVALSPRLAAETDH